MHIDGNKSTESGSAHALSCFFVKARGLLSKVDSLRNYAITMKLDVIGIAETFLDKDVMQYVIGIYGFTSYRKDRSSFKEGKAGGVVLFVRNDIVSYEYSELNVLKSESVWCRVNTASKETINIGVCCKSQAAEVDGVKELFKAIETASNEQVLTMGNFNYLKINWGTLECDSHWI